MNEYKPASVAVSAPQKLLSVVDNGLNTLRSSKSDSNLATGAKAGSQKLLGAVENGIVRFGGGAVGFIAEYKEHRRQRVSPAHSPPPLPPRRELPMSEKRAADVWVTTDEEAWAVEDAMDFPSPPSYFELEAVENRYGDDEKDCIYYELEAVQSRDNNGVNKGEYFRIPTNPPTIRPLEYPVIIPQRRPRDRSRGFARAYAPVLLERNIDQQTFLKFLKDFYTSSKASPVFNVIQVSGFLIGQAPEMTCKVISAVIGAAATLGEKAQMRARTNGFLRQANETLFKPNGLYAVIMKYKPASELEGPQRGDPGAVTIQEIDVKKNSTTSTASTNVNSVIQKTLGEAAFKSWFEKFRIDSGTTEGAMSIPKAAPLVFPEAVIEASEGPETFKERYRDFVKVLGDYNDRRAHIRYGIVDPDSTLALPGSRTELKSDLADPNHPINHNGFKGLFSGGKVLREDQSKEDEALSQQTTADSTNSEKKSDGLGAMLKRSMKKDVLYLMIVDLPLQNDIEFGEMMINHR